MKRILFGLFAAVVALSASAFTNANVKTARFATTWYQDSPGVYVPNPPSGQSCSQPTTHKCTIVFTGDVPTTLGSFNIADLPEIEAEYNVDGTQVGEQNYYN